MQRPKIRKYSKDTDMLLIIMHSEKYSIQRMAEILHRNKNDVKRRLILLFASGRAEKIHNYLMAYDGMYSKKMKGKYLILNIEEEKKTNED